MRYILLLFSLLAGLSRAPAQVQRIIHQTFELGDSISELELDLYGECRVEIWPGHNILLETQIKLYNATVGILEHFLEAGRYQLEPAAAGPLLRLVAKDQERRPIKTSKGECFEEVEQRLLIPEEFSPAGENRWRRPPPKAAQADTTGRQ